jgi:phosphohistidine phosphatase
MIVYLVRHGEALSAAENSERPLSQKGRQAVERIARLALDRRVHVTGIYHSGILRAKQTAELFAKVLSSSVRVEQHSGLLPEDDPAIVKAELDIAQQSILLVGHLPYLNRLTSLLIHGDPDRAVVDYLPATMVCCRRVGDRWSIDWTQPQPRI